MEKAQTRLTNLIAMRADGELSKEEYQTMRMPIDAEIQQLQEKLNQAPTDEQPKSGLELDGIINTLNTLIDFSGTKVSKDIINQFVYRVTPTSDTTFDWYVNLNGTADVKATFTAEGRKSRAVVKLEEIEEISSLHRKENEDNGMFLKNPLVFTFLHRRHMRTVKNGCSNVSVICKAILIFLCVFFSKTNFPKSSLWSLMAHILRGWIVLN